MSNSRRTLFEDFSARGPANVPEFGYLVTNQLNLMYLLSAGLIMPPEGFRGKHFQDSLGDFPGWIPLFLAKISRSALEAATTEANHLKPCLAQVGLYGLSGPVWALRGDAMVHLRFPEEWEGTESILFVPAPLPAAWIRRVIFQSQADLTASNRTARDYRNVPWTGLERKVLKKPFKSATSDAWPPVGDLPDRSAPLAVPLAAGGGLAMLLRMSHRSDLGVLACLEAFQRDSEGKDSLQESILAGVGAWYREGAIRVERELADMPPDGADPQSVRGRLFWEILDQVAQASFWPEALSPEDAVLDHLENSAERLPDLLRQEVTTLRLALEDIGGLGGLGATELFQRFKTPFSRALILFFLRQDCGELLEYRHVLLTEEDRLAAALLFGVRAGWQGLSLEMRKMPHLTPAVSHLMAALSQRLANTDLEFGLPPQRPRSLREAFIGRWQESQEAAARSLSQREGWNCLRTSIVLKHGLYELRSDAGGLRLEFEGEPEITHTVDRDRFLELLAGEKPGAKSEDSTWEELADETAAFN